MNEEEEHITVFMGTPEKRRLLERPRYKWKYNIKIDLRDICWPDVDWIHLLAEDRD
jgi:hypothetical protein